MNQHPHKPGFSKQRGVVVMIMLVIMVMGSAYFLIAALNKGDARQPGNIAATTEIGAVTDALIGYAIANNQCLPCPDTNGDGLAETTCGVAGAPFAGALPWLTLGLGAYDNWGRRLRYVVDTDFTGSTCTTYPSNIQSDIVVKGRDGTGTPIFPTTPANNPPAVVISHGSNGFGGTNEIGPMPNPPANNVDENTNSTATTNLMQREASDTASAAIGGPFDDLVGWVDRGKFQTQLEKIYPAW